MKIFDAMHQIQCVLPLLQTLQKWFVWSPQHHLQRFGWQLETQPFGASNFHCSPIFLDLVLRCDESDLGNRTRFASGFSRREVNSPSHGGSTARPVYHRPEATESMR